MSIPPTPKPIPTVPNAPGVPPLTQVANVQNNIVLLGADAASVISLFSGPQWGLFTQDGSPLFPGFSAVPFVNSLAAGTGISNTSVGEVGYRREYRISTAPQEQGAFLPYNKVQMPFDARISYLVSGLSAIRTAFLQQLEAAAASLDFYTVVMPEFIYPSANIIHHDFRRRARNGVTLLNIDIWVQEVRITGTAQFSSTNTAMPSGADAQSGGLVAAQNPEAGSAPPAGGLT